MTVANFPRISLKKENGKKREEKKIAISAKSFLTRIISIDMSRPLKIHSHQRETFQLSSRCFDRQDKYNSIKLLSWGQSLPLYLIPTEFSSLLFFHAFFYFLFLSLFFFFFHASTTTIRGNLRNPLRTTLVQRIFRINSGNEETNEYEKV